jgi:hypothetical protein
LVETEKLWRKLRKNSIQGTSLTYDLFINTFVQCNCAELAIQAYHAITMLNKLERDDSSNFIGKIIVNYRMNKNGFYF